MFPTLMLVLCLVAESPTATPSPQNLDAYEAARETVGRDPAAHIKLALWCEAHGLEAERTKHLAMAVLIEPKNATARGLMGLAAYHGSWQRPETITEKIKADEELTARLAEYNKRRAQLADTADAHTKLALWCEVNGLKAEAVAHFTAVTRLDPKRDQAWIHLGCKKQGGRWVTEAQLAMEKANAEEQNKADHYWKPQLMKWRSALGDNARRAEATEALSRLTDPRAARSVFEVFGRHGEANQRVAVQVLGQIDAFGSSQALALLAAWGSSPAIRRSAAEALRRRDPRDYVGYLLSLLREPYHFQTEYVETERERWFRRSFAVDRGGEILTVTEPARGNTIPQRIFTDDATFDPLGQSFAASQMGTLGGPMLDPSSAQTLETMIAQPQNAAALLSQHAAAVAHGQAMPGHSIPPPTPDQRTSLFIQNAMAAARQRDAQILWARTRPIALPMGPNFDRITSAAAEVDQQIRQDNSAIFASLNMITNQNLPEEREPWRKWYYDAQGYAYTPPKVRPKRSVVMVIPSCFAAGTPVRTLMGLRPIEQIEVGDQVLAQHPVTGKLTFEPVTAVHHNPPGETLRVQLVSDTIQPSIYHRFWRSGQGWAMARDLKPGDELRTLGGRDRVSSVSSGGVEKVYNLDVASSHSFFVGEVGALVHDNTLPALRAERFDSTSGPDAVAPDTR